MMIMNVTESWDLYSCDNVSVWLYNYVGLFFFNYLGFGVGITIWVFSDQTEFGIALVKRSFSFLFLGDFKTPNFH